MSQKKFNKESNNNNNNNNMVPFNSVIYFCYYNKKNYIRRTPNFYLSQCLSPTTSSFFSFTCWVVGQKSSTANHMVRI